MPAATRATPAPRLAQARTSGRSKSTVIACEATRNPRSACIIAEIRRARLARGVGWALVAVPAADMKAPVRELAIVMQQTVSKAISIQPPGSYQYSELRNLTPALLDANRFIEDSIQAVKTVIHCVPPFSVRRRSKILNRALRAHLRQP